MITKNSNAKQAWAPTTKDEQQKKLQENEKELQLRELKKSVLQNETKLQETLYENKDGLDLREFRKDDIWKISERSFYREQDPDVVLPLVMQWAERGARGPDVYRC